MGGGVGSCGWCCRSGSGGGGGPHRPSSEAGRASGGFGQAQGGGAEGWNLDGAFGGLVGAGAFGDLPPEFQLAKRELLQRTHYTDYVVSAPVHEIKYLNI